MPRRWAAELAPHESLSEVYLVKRKSSAVSPTNGKVYLSLVLMDRTGEIDTRVWDKAETIAAGFEEGDHVRVQGKTVVYQGRLQLHAAKVQRVPVETLDPADFLPCAETSTEALWACVRELLDTIANPHLRALVDRILEDPEFSPRLKRSPAGKTIHHARLGGLLEHSLATMRLADAICRVYEETYPGLVDRDLLLAAAFLHDAGKPAELSSDSRFEYTDVGRLVGHVVLGYELVSRHLEALADFPEDLALHLRHLMLSHHGERDFGSPKRPKTVEAWILHFVDLMDCRVAHTAELLAHLRPGQWTPYQATHDRYFWRGHQRVTAGSKQPAAPQRDAAIDAPPAAPPAPDEAPRPEPPPGGAPPRTD